MTIVFPSVHPRQTEPELETIRNSQPFTSWDHFHNSPNEGVVPALQKIYLQHQSSEIICFIHDDVTIHQSNWVPIIQAEFADPSVAIVGLGGAFGLGVSDIYKLPYNIWQLRRIDYCSNQRDWEVHGTQLEGPATVAVVDGFFMAVRSSFLKKINGWAGFPHNFHMYDAYLCLMAARLGMKVRAVGLECTHHGGGTSTSADYAEWCSENGTTMEREHEEPHQFIYNSFRDILPLVVK